MGALFALVATLIQRVAYSAGTGRRVRSVFDMKLSQAAGSVLIRLDKGSGRQSFLSWQPNIKGIYWFHHRPAFGFYR